MTDTGTTRPKKLKTQNRAESWRDSIVPVATLSLALLVFWYVMSAVLNAPMQVDLFANDGGAPTGRWAFISACWQQDRPVLPSPHQVIFELLDLTLGTDITSKKSLLYHGWITLSSTALGFAIGVAAGLALAIAITYVRTLEKSLMPWIIASQTIPLLAIAPMVIVVLASVNITGLLPKALISAYLSFFPVTVGMVKGLRSPEPMHLDLMRTYAASEVETFFKLRLPASLPFLFTSLKVGIAASLVGAIVGELPTGAAGGLGARLLSGSYYGQTVQIWATLIVAALMALLLVGIVAEIERFTRRRLGGR